jgi:glycerophosphoryl diester phosphodiesterase
MCTIRVISHRGNGFGHVENTLAAFRAAARAGVDGVELDVRLTRDRVPVVAHDGRTHPRLGPPKMIARTLRKDLPPRVPTLADALATLPRAMVVDVEIKPTRADLGPIAELLPRHGVRLSSFDWGVLRAMRRLRPDLHRALLVPSGCSLRGLLGAIEELRAEGVHLSMRQLTDTWAHAVRERGLALRVYTPNRAAEWRHCADQGVDAVMTDRPRAFLAWLAARH